MRRFTNGLLRLTVALPCLILASHANGQSKAPPPTVTNQAIISDGDISVTDFEDMVYPLVPQLRRIEGAVVVKAELDGTGRVTAATAVSGHEELVPPCLENVKHWRFRPNPKNAVVVVYLFRIDGSCYGFKSYYGFYPPNIMMVHSCKAMLQM